MKTDIHPEYHDITVVMTDGTEFVTRSTYGAPNARLQLDIDIKTHPAWTGQHRMINKGGQLAKFNKRFAGLGTKGEAAQGSAPVAAAPASEAKEDKIKLTTTKASTAKAAPTKAPAKKK